MTAPKKHSEPEIQQELERFPNWSLEEGKLHRDLVFENFVAAFSFMTAAAIEAEKMNHHPEWFNVYNRVRIDLSTHDVGGVSDRDFELAGTIDRLASASNPR